MALQHKGRKVGRAAAGGRGPASLAAGPRCLKQLLQVKMRTTGKRRPQNSERAHANPSPSCVAVHPPSACLAASPCCDHHESKSAPAPAADGLPARARPWQPAGCDATAGWPLSTQTTSVARPRQPGPTPPSAAASCRRCRRCHEPQRLPRPRPGPHLAALLKDELAQSHHLPRPGRRGRIWCGSRVPGCQAARPCAFATGSLHPSAHHLLFSAC